MVTEKQGVECVGRGVPGGASGVLRPIRKRSGQIRARI